jgi:chemotaxis protein MotB
MAPSLRWIGLAALAFALTGCVSQDQYSALKLERDRIAEQLTTAQREASQSKSAADAYKQQLDGLAGSGNTTAAMLANQATQISTLQAEKDELNRKYMEALARAGTGGNALPQPLTDTLTAFAQQNPDLVDFDSARGIVKFKSDVTFGVGDATVTAKAREVIDRFARILNSAGASSYELLVAGHTDNQPVHNQATIAAGHKDNWYLSAHRAIAVGNELIKNGVTATRIGVVGYADQRPIASNASAGGQQQNRRVEVLILPSTIHRAGTGVASGKRGETKASAKLNKDGAVVPSGPALNK